VTTTLIDNIGLLVTHDEERPELPNAALLIDDGIVAWVGGGWLRHPGLRRQSQPSHVRRRQGRRV
jgi:hypothetical protein